MVGKLKSALSQAKRKNAAYSGAAIMRSYQPSWRIARALSRSVQRSNLTCPMQSFDTYEVNEMMVKRSTHKGKIIAGASTPSADFLGVGWKTISH